MTLIQPDQPAEKETLVAPYDPLAPHYEAFMGDVRASAEWHGRLLTLVAEHGITRGRALDVGCGTGRSLASLRRAGFTAAGADPSARMLAEARARLGDDVPLEVAALPDLGPGERVDLVTALNDVVNYVAPDARGRAVGALAGRVAPGGLLLFDANTPLIYDTFFASTFCRDTPGRFFVWQGHEPEPRADGSSTHRADLHTFAAEPGDPERWTHCVSHQVQHHHPHARIVDAIADAGLTLLAVLGQREGAAPDPTCDEAVHTKRVYLARLP